MITRLLRGDGWIRMAAVLAVAAVLMLGWQMLSGLSQLRAGDASERAASAYGVMAAGLAAVAMLATALWRSERARARVEARIERLTDSLPGAFYVLRLPEHGAGRYEFLTAHAGNVLGVPRELVVQDARLAQRLVLPEDLARMDAVIARARTDMAPLSLDFRIQKQDGELRWIRTLAVPVQEPNQDVVLNGHLLDITDLRTAEQALQEATRRLEDAQRVANIGDWTCDLATGALTWSLQVYRMLQRDPAAGPPSLEEAVALFENGTEATAEAFFQAQESGTPQTYELTYRLPGGEDARLQVIAVAKLDETGTVRGMHGTIQDVTGHKALEEGLSHAKEAADGANQAKSVFLATMSHEIRTHLNGMLGILEVVFTKPLSPELQVALEGVRESGRSLQQIIDDILDFSKVEAGKLDIRPEATLIADLLAGVQRVHAGSASSVGLEIRHRVDPEIRPALMVDGLRLRQILGNFVSNSIKFTSSGHVEIRALLLAHDGEREHVRFEVEDTGIGVSSEHQQRLFQPFAQAHAHTASRFGGTGLGLSISRRLAELMGGQVTMSSMPGKGTTMILDLPLAVAEPALLDKRPAGNVNAGLIPSQDRKVPTASEAEHDGTLVLVVDDHPVNRLVMRSQLHVLGYAVEDVESGLEALEQWASGRFGLVLTDCNMPFISGYELSRRIREAEVDCGRRRTPIIACSANVIGSVHQECRDAGMDDYIPKPTELVALAEIMDRWLPLKKAGPPPAAAAAPTLEGPAPVAVAHGAPVDSPRVLEHFRRINDADVILLRQAVQDSDPAEVTHLAHRIKGACGFIGATALAAASGTLEQAGRSGAMDATERLMQDFERELERLNAYLDAQRSR